MSLRSRLRRADQRLGRRPGVIVLLAGLVLFAGSGLHLRHAMETDTTADDAGPAAEATDPVPSVVGPRLGADVEDYRRARHAELARTRLQQPARAVVSFVDHHAADDLPDLDDVRVEVVVLRVPVDGVAPVSVDVGDDLRTAVSDAIDDQRVAIDEEIVEVQALLDEAVDATPDDPGFDEAFDTELRQRLDALGGARNVLAVGAPVVYGAVVVAEVETLRALVGRDGIRLVDLGGGAADTVETTFHPILPEDRVSVTAGRGP